MVRQAHRLVIFRSGVRDPVVAALLDFLEGIAGGRLHTAKVARRVAASYSSFFAGLCSQAVPGREAAVGTPWQNHLLNLVLRDENPFSWGAERHGMGRLGPDLILQVEADLARLRELFSLRGAQVTSVFQWVGWDGNWPGWDRLRAEETASEPLPDQHLEMKRRLSRASDWGPLVAELGDFYRRNGTGIFGEFRAFHWDPRPQGGRLQGIASPDPIGLEEPGGVRGPEAVADSEHPLLPGRPPGQQRLRLRRSRDREIVLDQGPLEPLCRLLPANGGSFPRRPA